MYEVEVKVEAAHGPVRERLAEAGAEPLGTVRQHDTYYDHPIRDFAATDEALRLRRETDGDGAETATLTYKGPLVDDAAKTREEVETTVTDPGATDAILRAVGFSPAADVDKERERFAWDGFTVALDAVDCLGDFVEVEAEAAGDAVAARRAGAFDRIEQLGLDPDATIRTSYLSMLLG